MQAGQPSLSHDARAGCIQGIRRLSARVESLMWEHTCAEEDAHLARETLEVSKEQAAKASAEAERLSVELAAVQAAAQQAVAVATSGSGC